MTESEMQKMFRQVAEQAQRQAAEKRREEVIKLQAALYDKGAAYVNLILAAGYAGFFATWANVKSELTKIELVTSALCVAFSLVVFVLWEVAVMLYAARSVRGLGTVFEAAPNEFDKRLAEAKVAEAKATVRIRRWWYAVLVLTLVPGLAGGAVLFSGLLRRLLALL